MLLIQRANVGNNIGRVKYQIAIIYIEFIEIIYHGKPLKNGIGFGTL
jgi:hypothetical protein